MQINYKLLGKKLIPKAQRGRKVNWEKLKRDKDYKQFNWKMNTRNLSILQDSLIRRGAGPAEQIAIFSQVIPESGGDTKPHGNGAHGLVGWRGTRSKTSPYSLPRQIHHLMETIYNNPEGKDWSHGGEGMGIQTGKEMNTFFKRTTVPRKAVNAFMRGYVRPPKDQYDKRQEFAKLLGRYIK